MPCRSKPQSLRAGEDEFVYFNDFLSESNPNSDERYYVLLGAGIR